MRIVILSCCISFFAAAFLGSQGLLRVCTLGFQIQHIIYQFGSTIVDLVKVLSLPQDGGDSVVTV